MRQHLFLPILAALIASAPSLAGLTQSDSTVLLDGGRLQLQEILGFSSGDARAQREGADADMSGSIDAAEVQAFEANYVASRVGGPTPNLRWDGTQPVWAELSATTQNFDKKGFNSGFSLILEGLLLLTPTASLNHTLTISNLSAFSNYTFWLTVPPAWSIVAVSGVSVSSQTLTSLGGSVDPLGVAVIEILENPGGGPLPFDDQAAPLANAGPDRVATAGTLTILSGTATDDDPSFPNGAAFWWTLTYDGSPLNVSGPRFSFPFFALGSYTLTLWVADAAGRQGSDTMQLAVVAPDTEAPTVSAGADTAATAGAWVALEGNAVDNDGAFLAGALFWWEFEYDHEDRNLSGLAAWFLFDIPGSYNVTLFVRDAWGNMASDTRTVTVTAPASASASSGSSGTPPDPTATAVGAVDLTPVFFAVAGLAALVGLVAYRRRSANAEISAAAPPAPVLAGPSYVLEGLFILYRDGRLIHHVASGSQSQLENPEVLGSMFTAVSAFIRDSFREAGALSRLNYGQNTILLNRSRNFFAAAIAYGEPDEAFIEQLQYTVTRLESAYSGVAEHWTGDRSAFGGVGEIVAPLFVATASSTRSAVRESSADKSVRLLSGTEHYKGYVRLKVALVNRTSEAITDAFVTVQFNNRVLHLTRVDPPGLDREGALVRLGDIAPGERVGAVYYLDPQACNETNIDGSATYRDAQGNEHKVEMKTRRAEIVCPIFFTPENANGAMLARLVETSLAARDSKLYRMVGVRQRVDAKAVFLLAMGAVRRYDVRLVRTRTAQAPFNGLAWFYGVTKATQQPVVIRLSVSEERGTIEFFVAAQGAAHVTGLLAEIHHSFGEMLREHLPGVVLDPLVDDRLKGRLSADEFPPA